MTTETETKIQRYEPSPQASIVCSAAPAARPGTVEMREQASLLTYWRMLRKRRWTVLIVFAVLFTIVFLGTLKETRIYRAGALLEIEKENPNILTVQELFEMESVSDTYLETEYRVLRERHNSAAGHHPAPPRLAAGVQSEGRTTCGNRRTRRANAAARSRRRGRRAHAISREADGGPGEAEPVGGGAV